MIRVEGFENSVKYRLEELRKKLAAFGDCSVTFGNQTDGWRWVRDLEMFQNQSGDIWRLSVAPSAAPGVVANLAVEDALYDRGGGQVFVRVPEGTSVRSGMSGVPGHATRLRGASSEPRFHPEAEPLAKLAAGLRQNYDPRAF